MNILERQPELEEGEVWGRKAVGWAGEGSAGTGTAGLRKARAAQ